jgi:hypothetical protein
MSALEGVAHMLKTCVAHVAGAEKDADGRVLGMTMFNRGEHGVLIWAGRLHSHAEDKRPDDITPGDYFSRETVSFMSWQDIETYFAQPAYAPVVNTLLTQFKRYERPSGSSEQPL